MCAGERRHARLCKILRRGGVRCSIQAFLSFQDSVPGPPGWRAIVTSPPCLHSCSLHHGTPLPLERYSLPQSGNGMRPTRTAVRMALLPPQAARSSPIGEGCCVARSGEVIVSGTTKEAEARMHGLGYETARASPSGVFSTLAGQAGPCPEALRVSTPRRPWS
jgi:hypothetical protein